MPDYGGVFRDPDAESARLEQAIASGELPWVGGLEPEDKVTDELPLFGRMTMTTPELKVHQTCNVPVQSLSMSVVAPAGVQQTCAVPTSSLSMTVVAPARVDQATPTIPVSLLSMSVVAPARVDQTVAVPVSSFPMDMEPPGVSTAASQAIMVPLVGSLSLDVVVPRIDQTVGVELVGTLSMATQAPVAGRGLDVPVSAMTFAMLAPVVDQTVVVPVQSLAMSVIAPAVSVDTGPHETMHNIVRGRLQSALTAAGITEVLWPNEYWFDENGDPKIDYTVAVWAEVEVRSTAGRLVGWGEDHRYRKFGDFRVKLRGPLEHGDGEILERLAVLRPYFLDLVYQGVRFLAPSGSDGARDEEGYEAQHRHDLVCGFEHDDTVALTQRQLDVSPTVAPDLEAMHNSARGRFDRVITQALGVSTAWDNAAFDPPDAQFVVHTVQTAEPAMAATTKTPGMAIAMIATPEGEGTGAALALADQIVLRFRSVHEAGVNYLAPYVRTIGRVPGGRYQTNVFMPFRAMETP